MGRSFRRGVRAHNTNTHRNSLTTATTTKKRIKRSTTTLIFSFDRSILSLSLIPLLSIWLIFFCLSVLFIHSFPFFTTEWMENALNYINIYRASKFIKTLRFLIILLLSSLLDCLAGCLAGWVAFFHSLLFIAATISLWANCNLHQMRWQINPLKIVFFLSFYIRAAFCSFEFRQKKICSFVFTLNSILFY